MGHLPTRCSSSVVHNDLVFIVYGAILRRYYKAVGYSTVEQPPKKDRKRQVGTKKAGRHCSRLFYDKQASIGTRFTINALTIRIIQKINKKIFCYIPNFAYFCM
ncbi:hypothetical protein HMPREF9010_00667 [Bacteroides sp. 3_1_23]|nr:hypothetical protein HMPREF9010_00667 [Bacteroides sp. 3_1_23]